MIPMYAMTKAQYLRDPCGCASIPYWKAKSIVVPESMMIVHGSAYQQEACSGYADEPYFRLYHDLLNLTEPSLPAGFSVCTADLADFAAHINQCYTGIGVTEAEVRSYTERVVYNAALWLAVQDDQTGKIVATAIGELDAEVSEGVLEWVQVSADQRGQGLGSYLVQELLWRMKGLADFATVSGKCNDPSCPERLYRKCGFTGNDVWHILRKT